MTREFIWLIWRGAVNRLHRQRKRLRNPRYLIAILIGLAYFGLIFSGWLTGGDTMRSATERRLHFGGLIGPVMLALLAAWWWLWGGYRRAILLSPAETDLLLPAPLPRRAIVRLKILQAQLPMLISTTLFTAFTRGAPLAWPLRAVSLWVMFATLHMHQVAASLVHAAAEEHGGRGLRRNRVAVALFSVGFVVLAVSIVRALLAARAAGSLAGAASAALAVLEQPATRLVLAPFRALIAPTLATSVATWLPAFGIAIALLVLHYLWVQRTDAAFEETAATEGARLAEQIATIRSGGRMRLSFSREHRPARLRRPWQVLKPDGIAAYAIFWKNTVYVQRLLRRSTIFTVGFVLVMMLSISLPIARSAERGLHAIATLLLAFAGLVSLFGPFMFRNDLRMDLPFIDLLRTYPLRGRDVVIAAMSSSVVCVIAIQLALLLAALVVGVAGGLFSPWVAAGLGVAGLLASPVLNAMAVLIPNAIALLFPAWARLGAHGGGGMEAIGQNMLNLIGSVVMLVLVMIPPTLVGLIVAAPVALQFGNVAVLPGAAAFIAAVAVEAGLLTYWLGGVYDRLDVTEMELLSGSAAS